MPRNARSISIRRASGSTALTASATSGTSVPSSSSSTSHEGPASTRRTAPAPIDAAADQIGGQPLALGQRRRSGDQQELAAERVGRIAVVDALEPHQRPLVGARAALDRPRPAGDRHERADLERCSGSSTAKRAVEAVRRGPRARR